VKRISHPKFFTGAFGGRRCVQNWALTLSFASASHEPLRRAVDRVVARRPC
jgi:hypothetical protein